MARVFAIFRREFWSAFDSPLAYIVVPAFLSLAIRRSLRPSP